ncbi:uncharacterized protein BXZ73DRAFT_105773 [Epithele typhae]|uniref:uncharacterized protein n=1 Tax=Epithele typhae TaxID=378194 RepID=UPI0020075080|nr:uncharacterized protein BXZ73DRAFT_105773 [Epithele typhae]KAH9916580.1 hypothetical protein BXZ73DRAFT_105773 [Epithele typhae]
MPLDAYALEVVQSQQIVLIIGLFLQGIFFSPFLVNYLKSVWLLSSLRVSVLFALHVNVGNALQLYRSDPEDGIDPFSDSTADTYTMIQFLTYFVQVIIGDAFMLYRLYVVWEKRWKAVTASTLIFVGNTLAVIVVIGLIPRGAKFVGLYFFPLSFIFNAITTGLITYRLLSATGGRFIHAHFSRRSRVSVNAIRYRRAFTIIIESAAIYSFASLGPFISFFTSPNTGYQVIACVMSPIIGLTFSLIVVRMAEGFVEKTSTYHEEMRSPIALRTYGGTSDAEDGLPPVNSKISGSQ